MQDAFTDHQVETFSALTRAPRGVRPQSTASSEIVSYFWIYTRRKSKEKYMYDIERGIRLSNIENSNHDCSI